MVATYKPWILNQTEVAELIVQGIGFGVLIVFSVALTGFVINKLIKLGMGNL
jgi:hypothetical protein